MSNQPVTRAALAIAMSLLLAVCRLDPSLDDLPTLDDDHSTLVDAATAQDCYDDRDEGDRIDPATVEPFWDPANPILHLDPTDPATECAAEIVPGAPWIRPGPDGELGTADDEIIPEIIGDVDLVIRSGLAGIEGPIPVPLAGGRSVPVGVAEPFGAGLAIDFVVIPSDGRGAAVAPDYFEELPVLVLAFADLDGDGYVGITHLDGDATDGALEEAELVPVGERYALGANGTATGRLSIEVGGPPEAPARVALTASAFAGPLAVTCSSCHATSQPSTADLVAPPELLPSDIPVTPSGPAVMTHVPFLPKTDPDGLFIDTPRQLVLARPRGAVAVKKEPALRPDPSDPRIGEAFTLRLDGSDPSIDVAYVLSGFMSRFGMVRHADPAHFRVAGGDRPLRPAVDPAGNVFPGEVLTRLVVDDDGPESAVEVRVVALDRLGNVTAPPEPTQVVVRTRGIVEIRSPDTDRDPSRETVVVSNGSGALLLLDDAGGLFDGADRDSLVVDAGFGLTRVDAILPDPDVDDSGLVDQSDRDAVAEAIGEGEEPDDYDPVLDVNGDGRLDDSDLAIVELHMGRRVAVP